MPITRKNVEVIFRPKNQFGITTESLRWGKRAVVLMLLRERMIERKSVNLLAFNVTFSRKKVQLKKYWAIQRWRTSRVENCNWTSFRKMNKKLQSLFKRKGLQILMNLKVVNYLDVTFNLNDRPYRKPNDGKNYIQMQSDQPPSIIKGFPLKSAHHSYHLQKIYFTKRHHVMGKV